MSSPPSIAPRLRPGGATHIGDEAGGAWLSRPAPDVLFWELEGKLHAALLPLLVADLDAMNALGKPFAVFVDAVAMRDFEGAVRDALAAWFVKNRASLTALHVLHKSAIVAMGVAIANLALRGFVTSHRETAPFEKALAVALRRGD